MLARALQKANTAVLLDNAQNFEAALHLYSEVCDLLHIVMLHSDLPDDREKLHSVKLTYRNRIQELNLILTSSTSSQTTSSAFSPLQIVTQQYSQLPHLSPSSPTFASSSLSSSPSSSSSPSNCDSTRSLPFQDVTSSLRSPPSLSILPLDASTSNSPFSSNSYIDTISSTYPSGTSLDQHCIPPPSLPLYPRNFSPPLSCSSLSTLANNTDFPLTTSLPSTTAVPQRPLPYETPSLRDTPGEYVSWLDTIYESSGSSPAPSEFSASLSVNSYTHSPKSKPLPPQLVHRRTLSQTPPNDNALLTHLDENVDINNLQSFANASVRVPVTSAGILPHHNGTESVISSAMHNISLTQDQTRQTAQVEALQNSLIHQREQIIKRLIYYQKPSCADAVPSPPSPVSEFSTRPCSQYVPQGESISQDVQSSSIPFGISISGVPDPVPTNQVALHHHSSSSPSLVCPSMNTFETVCSHTSSPSQDATHPTPLTQGNNQPAVSSASLNYNTTLMNSMVAPLPSTFSSSPSSSSSTSSFSSSCTLPSHPVANISLLSPSVTEDLISGASSSSSPIKTSFDPFTGKIPHYMRRHRLETSSCSSISLASSSESVSSPTSRTFSHKGPLLPNITTYKSNHTSLPSITKSDVTTSSMSSCSQANSGHSRMSSSAPCVGVPLTHVESATSFVPYSPPAPPSHLRLFGRGTFALRKNKSSFSLRNRALSFSSSEVGCEAGSSTTGNSTGSLGGSLALFPRQSKRVFTVNGPPSHGSTATSRGNIGLEESSSTHQNASLFDCDLHYPDSPGTPNPFVTNPPSALEACPDGFLLRPYWLMRCLYRTLTHPRGGYMSMRMFIPRDVWCVRGVKLRALDEKISMCDMITNGLQKLIKIEPMNWEALAIELRNLDGVFAQAQTCWNRKLGSEVGPHGANGFLSGHWDKMGLTPGGLVSTTVNGGGNGTVNGGSSSGDCNGSSTSLRAPSSTGKHYLSNLLKLRGKSSVTSVSDTCSVTSVPCSTGTNLFPATASSLSLPLSDSCITTSRTNSSLLVGVDSYTTCHSTVPMTSSLRTIERLQDSMPLPQTFPGPNSMYMESLAKLFDAAQVFDCILRRLNRIMNSEPSSPGGLSPTSSVTNGSVSPLCRSVQGKPDLNLQAEIEARSRMTTEFFAFYVCRFVLSDLSSLMDKFIKRGAEWMIA